MLIFYFNHQSQTFAQFWNSGGINKHLAFGKGLPFR
jgi:hypothetical protein